MQLFKELQRRNVFRVAIGYLVSAWLLTQAADLVLDIIGSPDWVLRTIVLVLGLGFPVVTFFAWAYEVTPEGIKREAEVDRSQSITHVTGKKLDMAIIAMLVLALGYFIWESRFSAKQAAEVAEVANPTVTSEAAPDPQDETETPDRKSIAVLPFDNRSNREEDQFFTDGIHDDLLTTIAKIGSMKVISRTSVMEYKGTTKKIPEIASELGVAHVLEGGIQRSGNQVRINVQLIDAQTDEHLWAEIFDRELTAENLFSIQSEISNKIAEALQATLTPREQERVNAMPTDNLAAYEAYYRGKQLMATRRSAELEEATREFEKAVELDPEFALAWVGVADSHLLFYSYADKPRAGAIEIRENAVQQALALDPDLGEAWVSLATIHEDLDRDEEAETAYRKAIELSPNYATAYHWYASSFLDDVLRSRERLDLAYRAVELDPRSLIIGTFLAGELGRQGLYSRAEQRYRDLIDLDPEFPNTYYSLSEFYLESIADYASALVNARRGFEIDSGTAFALLIQRQIFIEIGDFETAAALQEEIIDRDPDSYLVGLADLSLALHNGNRAAAREAINWTLPHVQDYPFITSAWLKLGYLAIGDMHRARELYIQSTPEWLDPDTWEMTIRKNPGDACEMAWLFVQTGDAELGEQLLVQATDFLENQLPAAIEHASRFTPEVCYLLAGDTAKALDIMETQLSHGHLGYWGIWLRAPFFDPIRHEPRFHEFLEEHDRLIAIQREAVEELLAQDTPGEPL